MGDNIFQIFEDSRGDIWIGMWSSTGDTVQGDRVARFERRTRQIRAFSAHDGYAPPYPSAPTGFAEDLAGNIWVGCYHG